jgi:NAD(P) transhydrogenase subunit alpha
MKIAILKETRPHERRVAATPDTVKRLIGLGLEVVVQSEAGLEAAFTDASYEAAGAKIARDAKAAADGAGIVLKVQRPQLGADGPDELGYLAPGTVLIAMPGSRLSPWN